MTVQEDTELIGGIPCVKALTSTYFTPSMVNGAFSNNTVGLVLPNIFLAVNEYDVKTRGTTLDLEKVEKTIMIRSLVWTSAINISSNLEMFVSLPGCMDIKVGQVQSNAVSYTYLYPCSKVSGGVLKSLCLSVCLSVCL